ncbi:MAG: alanine:cation symporter family protein, partial [Acidobacteria bacterium]|nr:alanine:cation symporter family protein [Acidobacteriota bacterium]
TLIGWAYYGEKCIEFMFGSRVIRPYRVVFTVMVLVGTVVSVPLVWAIGTLLNGLMAFPTLLGVAFLVGTVRSLTLDYFASRST